MIASLTKCGHVFNWLYAAGDEEAVIKAIVNMAVAGQTPLDMCDADRLVQEVIMMEGAKR